LPAGTDVVLSTRSGNTSVPDPTWSDWSPVVSNPDGQEMTSPPAKYIQCQLSFSTNNTSISPEVAEVILTFRR